MIHPFLFLRYALLILAFFVQTSFADEAKVKLSLISESKTVGNETTLNLGLRAKIIPGWKTYWRSPGVAGYGVTFTLDGSTNVKSVNLLWPIPHRSQTQMGQVNAYEGDVVFPLKVEVVDPSKPVHLNLNVDMLVCDVGNCLPVMETINLDLPAGLKRESAEAALIQKALKNLPERKIPETHDFGSFQIERVALQGSDEIPPTLQVVLSKENDSFSEGDLPEIFLEMKDKLVDAPVVTLSKDRKSVRYSAAVYPDSNRVPTLLTNLIGTPVTLTIKYQNELLEVDQTLKMQQLSFGLLAAMLLAAFIGGLILNIMPCVLPVLSLKVLSVMRHGGGNNAIVRHEFMATVLGILFSFLVLAGGAIFLKLSGEAVGWGVQFQEPHFLIALVGILTLFACNLFGFFEFRLPPFLSTLGGITPKRESWVGSFLEGSLVTALATPCTAPFLGTALAFALSRGIYEILLTFIVMGLGLAFPFLLIAFFPKMATKLPKPGAWMITVKYVFGALILLTALWLVYVLIAEIGMVGAYSIAGLMLVLSLLLKSTGKVNEARKKMAWIAASLLIAASFTLPTFLRHPVEGLPAKVSGIWHPFEPERIQEYVKEGKTVFVNVTADWCLTCQMNKLIALKIGDVEKALSDPNVIAMEADWTKHDPKITAYLKSFNQYGIPFYAVYGCKTPAGRFLGQILTPQTVLEALESEKCR